MTIDERAAACRDAINRLEYNDPSDFYDKEMAAIIARTIREAVAERDALLRECRHLMWHHHVGESCMERITAMIGGHDDA